MYANGWAKCFHGDCGRNFRWDRDPGEEKEGVMTQEPRRKPRETLEEIQGLPMRGVRSRLISRKVAEFYGVRCAFDEDGEPVKFYFPFSENLLETTGYKHKDIRDKSEMYTVGSVSVPFGLEHFQRGGRKIIITEGEWDAMAIQTANEIIYDGRTFPVISMGSSTSVNYLAKYRSALERFEEIVLWFDNDAAGHKAVAEAAKLFGYEKVKHVKTDYKDANDVLMDLNQGTLNDRARVLNKLVWDAGPYIPSGVVNGEDTWESFIEFQNLVFVPWAPFLDRLNTMTHGRSIGSITMFVAGTGVGKSSFLREDISHVFETTQDKIGICMLEEGIGESVNGILSIRLSKRLGLPDVESSAEEQREAWEQFFGTGRVMLVNHEGVMGDSRLLDALEYLAISGCRFIYLDHITIAVDDIDDNSSVDRFMKGLLAIVKKYPVWIGVVSHLRKVRQGEDSFETGGVISEDDLKGSGALKQISFQTIALSRNKQHPDAKVRQQTQIFLLKDRRTGSTGPAGGYRYDTVTGRLRHSDFKPEVYRPPEADQSTMERELVHGAG